MATPEDWVQAALKALKRGGPEAVRVEPLAAKLKVTKGSFYWHFRDRAALLDAVLERWEEIATSRIIEEIDGLGSDPAAKLAALVARSSQSSDAPQLEGAVRAWSASDPRAKKVTVRVDRRRETYVADLLKEIGLPAKVAQRRARILYLALIGEFSVVAYGGEPSGRAPFDDLVSWLTLV